MSASVAETLGRFVASAAWSDLPPAMIHEAKRALLNFAGCALSAADQPAIATAVRVLQPFSGADTVSLIGRRERLDAMAAAFVNAVASNLMDFDDTHLPTVIHPTAPVAAPALALGERDHLSGARVLHAFVLGAEVECRIGNAVTPGHYARGWHITSTCGVFGSAVAAAKLLGLNAEQTAHALGIAASQSAGSVESLTAGAKNVSVGNAARNGIFAALMAGQGINAAPASIEGKLGWARSMGDEPNIAAMTDGLGSHWEFAANTYKPYPCGIVLHAVLDACLGLRADGIAAERIAAVIVQGNRLLLDRGDRMVADERDARVSIHHCVAVAFLHGHAGLPAFGRDMVFDADVVAFRERVRAECDPDLPTGAARVVVIGHDGQRAERLVMHARGSASHPMTDAEIEAKTRGLATDARRAQSLDRIVADFWHFEDLPDVTSLMRLLAVG
jgi:2-methylcitrate dehydratase PrpD